MQWQFVAFAMLPSVAYAVLVSRVSLRATVVTVIAISALEFIFNSAMLGTFDVFSFASLLLFVATGALSAQRENTVYLRLQPVALEIGIGLVFFVSMVVFDRPLFAILLEEYVGVFDVIPPYQRGYFAGYARTMSNSLPFLLFIHAGLVGAAATLGSIRTWIWVRTLGLHAMIVALFFAERLLIEPV